MLCGNSPKAELFQLVTDNFRQEAQKHSDVKSTRWQVHEDRWLDHPANLQPRAERQAFHCGTDVFNYHHLPECSLVVDFANQHVGGAAASGTALCRRNRW